MTQAERVREALAQDIIRGRRRPGSALEEEALARDFGVSRTPVREALRLLAASGLVLHRPRRGAEVAMLSDRALDQIFALMADLEALCAGHAAQAMTTAERAALGRAHGAMAAHVRAGDIVAYAEANDRFHAAIYAGTHNPYLTELTLEVRRRAQPYRRAQFESLGRLAASHHEHGGIVEAILQGSRRRAEDTMRLHIEGVRNAYVALPRDCELPAAS
jgi:DNA-binding GntR family transcriptional regulator